MARISELLKAPLQDKKWLEKLAIGGVVCAVPILSFCGMGYIVNLLKGVIKKKEGTLPEWFNWGKLFSDGIIYFVICFVYMLIPALVFTIGIIAGKSIVGLVFGALMMFIAAIAWLAAAFLLPMAICHYVATDDIKSAFAWNDIQEKIKSTVKDYGLAYLKMIGLFIAAYIVSYIAAIIIFFSIIVPPLFVLLLIFGFIFVGFLFFYLGLIFAGMFGEIYPVQTVKAKKTVSEVPSSE